MPSGSHKPLASLAALRGRRGITLGATARRAALWLVREALLGEELLFRRGEHEILPAIAALDRLVLVAHRMTSYRHCFWFVRVTVIQGSVGKEKRTRTETACTSTTTISVPRGRVSHK